MATEQQVRLTLRELLETADLDTATERSLTAALEQQLGPVQAHRKLIKQLIEDFLTEQDAVEAAEAAPPPKKQRTSSASAAGGNSAFPLQLSRTKYLNINQFKGSTLVDLREYYDKDGVPTPGPKGIALKVHEWAALRDVLPQAMQALVAGDSSFAVDLGGDRRASVSEFRGSPLLQVREYYSAGGELKPGKKGVALDADAVACLVDNAAAVDAALPAAGGAAKPTAAVKPATAAAKAAGAAAAPAASPAAPAAKAAAPVASQSGGSTATGVAVSAGAASTSGGGGGASFVDLGGNRRLSVSRWKGALQVDLREYYDAGGEIKPGKKGICLSAADWATICTNEADISAAAAAGRDSYVLKLSGTRQVNINRFKGATYVAIREYYEKGGQLLPGAKGMNLNLDGWHKVVAGMRTVEALMQQA